MGDWTHSRSNTEQAQRYKAIDEVTQGISGFVRGRARQLLKEKTTPHPSIGLTDDGDRVTISGNNRRVTFTTDGSPNLVPSERTTATLRAKRQDGKLVVTIKAKNGTQTTVYSLSEDGKHLVLDTTISGGKLSTPIRFRATYNRNSSSK